jgi:hypothetical protein
MAEREITLRHIQASGEPLAVELVDSNIEVFNSEAEAVTLYKRRSKFDRIKALAFASAGGATFVGGGIMYEGFNKKSTLEVILGLCLGVGGTGATMHAKSLNERAFSARKVVKTILNKKH